MSDIVDTSPLGIERTERIAGDEALNSRLDTVTTELQSTQESVTTEVLHRSEGDLVIQRILEGYIQDLLEGKAEDFERYIEFQNSQNLNYADVRNFVSSIRTSLADDIRNLSTSLMNNLQANDARYNKLVSDVDRYLEILSDITLDSNQITLDNGELRAGAWTILSQARAWDLEIISRLNGLSGSVGDSLKDAVEEIQNQLPSTEETITKAIEELSNSPIIKNLSDLLNQSIENDTAYQNELLEQARQHANDMAQLAEDMRAEALAKAQAMEDYIAGEVTARITEVNKEVAARKEAIDLLTEDMLTRVDQDKADFQADMLAVTNRIESAEDGLTSEIQHRKDGDASTLNALNTYKVSNDSAITGLSTSLSNNVTKTNANTTLITGLTSRLDTAEDGIESATTAAADAMSKATTAVSANSALALRVDALAASITESDGTVVDVNAFNALKAEVNTVKGTVTGLVEDVTALESNYTSVNTKVTSQGTAIGTLNTKMSTAENSISQSANDITLLKTDISSINAGLLTKVDSQAFSQLSSDVSELDGKYTTQAGLVTDLRGSLDTTNVNVGNAASAAQNALNTAGSKGKVIFGTTAPAVADRLSQNLWIDTTGNANTPKRWNGSAWVVVTDKVATDALAAANAATNLANTKADATAFNSLDQKVTVIDGNVNTNTNSITSLNGKIAIIEGDLVKKADASALSSLTTRVETEEGKSTSQGSAITSLQNTVNHATTGLSSKASSAALTVVDNKVTAVDGRVNTTNSNIATLTGRVSTVEGGLATKADVSALNALTTRVDSVEGELEVVSSSITSLESSIADKADASALSSLTTRVAAEEGKSTSQGTAITNLENAVNHATTGLASKASSQALTAVDNKVIAVDGRVTTTNSNVATLTGRVETVEGGLTKKADATALNSYYTKVEADTAIAGQITAYKATVDNALGSKLNASVITNYYTSAQTDNKIDSIASGKLEEFKATFSLADKRYNLLEDPFFHDPNKWSGSLVSYMEQAQAGSDSYVVTSDPYPRLITAFSRTGAANGFAGDLFNPFTCEPEVTYQLSLDVRRHTTNAKGDWQVYLAWFNLDGTQISANLVASGAIGQETSTKVIGTAISPAGALRASVRFRLSMDSNGEVYVNYLSIANLKVVSTPSFVSNALSSLEATVDTVNGKVTTQAESLLVLRSDVDSNKNALIVQGKVVDGVKASYMVKMETNGVIGGFGLMQSTGVLGQVKTSFGVNADSFFIGAPASKKQPFIVTTANQVVNGVTYPAGTYIDVALIANATIGTAHIANASITNAKIASLDASKITTGTLDAARIRVGAGTQYDAGYDPSDYGWKIKTTATDFNAMKTTGKWLIKGTRTNAPFNAWTYLIVDAADSTRVIQTAYADNNVAVAYQRTFRDSTWDAWVKTNITPEFENVTTVVSGQTLIEGGKIRTNSITANQINASVFKSVGADGSSSTISGGTMKAYYPNGKLAFHIGVS